MDSALTEPRLTEQGWLNSCKLENIRMYSQRDLRHIPNFHQTRGYTKLIFWPDLQFRWNELKVSRCSAKSLLCAFHCFHNMDRELWRLRLWKELMP